MKEKLRDEIIKECCCLNENLYDGMIWSVRGLDKEMP